jgi:hypothetical protein
VTAGTLSCELWWTNQEFSLSVAFRHGSSSSDITWGMNNRPVGGRSSEIQFHPIGTTVMMMMMMMMMIIIIIIAKLKINVGIRLLYFVPF